MPNDAAQSILAPLQIDNSLKADAWEAFNSSTNEVDLQVKLMGMKDLPQSAKADLWEAKHGMAAPPANPINQSLSGATGISAAPSPGIMSRIAQTQVPGTGVTVGQAGQNAWDFTKMAGSTAAGLVGPEAGVGQLAKILPAARMAKAGEALNQVSQAIGKHTVPISEGLSKATMYAKQIMESGGGNVKVINDFLKRMTNPELGPLTFDEGREFLKNASKLSIKEIQTMKGSMGAAVKTFASELGSTLTEVANKAGESEKYLQALKDYGSAARTGAKIKQYGPPIAKAAATGAAGTIGAGAGYEFLKRIGVVGGPKSNSN